MSLPFIIECKDDWYDITEEVEGVGKPWTLAKTDGVGALQFSVAIYKGGQIPNPSPQVLLSLLRDFALLQKLGEATDIVTEDRELRIAAASFRPDDYFMRVWYVSNGSSFAKVTYTCALGMQQRELPECEAMIRTLKFENAKRAV